MSTIFIFQSLDNSTSYTTVHPCQHNIIKKKLAGTHEQFATQQHDILKTDINLHKQLKVVVHQQPWHSVAHPCQESIEVVWFWLFVTEPFFHDGWTTVLS